MTFEDLDSLKAWEVMRFDDIEFTEVISSWVQKNDIKYYRISEITFKGENYFHFYWYDMKSKWGYWK
jgi:hypothetical protein